MRALLFLLLAFTVFGSVDYAVLRANHNARMTEATQKLQAMHESVKANIESLKSFELQDDAEDACNNAKTVFVAVWLNNNCSVISEVWDKDTSETRVGEIYQTYCVAEDSEGYTCKAKVEWAFKQYLANCSQHIDPTVLENQRNSLALSSITCLTDETDPSHLCLNDFKALQNLGESYTKDTLDNVCTDCVRKVFLAFDLYAKKEFLKFSTYLNLLCFQLNGEYCSLKFIEAIGTVGPVGAAGPTDDQLKLMCQPCIAAFISKHLTTVTAFGGSLTEVVEEARFLKLIRVMCISNPKGEYCFTKLTSAKANATFSAMGLACLPGVGIWVATAAKDTCTPSCHTEIEKANVDLGCCFGTWWNLLEWQKLTGKYELPHDPDVLQSYVKTQCGLTIPVGCASQKVAVAIVLRNIAWQWYLDHKDVSEKDLKSYIMWLLNLDDDQVGNVIVSQVGTTMSSSSSKYQLLENDNTESIKVETVVYPSTDADVNTVTDNAKSATEQSNPIANGWELTARSDPSAPVTAASAEARPVGGGAFATNSPAYYLATFIVAIVTLLLL